MGTAHSATNQSYDNQEDANPCHATSLPQSVIVSLAKEVSIGFSI